MYRQYHDFSYTFLEAGGDLLYLEGSNYTAPFGDGSLSDSIEYNPEKPIFGGGYELTTNDGTSYVINASTGFIGLIEDREGNTLEFASDTQGDLVTSTDETGVIQGLIRVIRDDQNRITSIYEVDPQTGSQVGEAVVYAYDSAGNLESVTDRSSRTTTFVYGEDHAGHGLTVSEHYLTSIIDARGVVVAEVHFDAEGRLAGIQDASGAIAPFNYTLDGTDVGLPSGYTVETVSDANGRTTEVVRDAGGNTIATLQQSSDTGVPATETFLISTFRYDSEDRQTHVSTPFTFTGQGTPNGQPNRFTVALDIISDPNDAGYVASDWSSITAFDSQGRVNSTTDAAGNTTYFSDFDQFGNPGTIADANGTTHNIFASNGKLQQTTDAAGNVTQYAYDTKGNLQSLTQFDDAGTAIQLATYFYDSHDRLTKVVDQSGTERHFIYDDQGRQTHSWSVWTDPDNATNHVTQVSETVYDEEGRATASSQYTLLSEYTTDTAVLSAIASATADGSTSTVYNAAGQVASSTNQFGNTSAVGYDARGNTVLSATPVKDESGTTLYMLSLSVFDTNGRLLFSADPFTSATDPFGLAAATAFTVRGSQNIYDALGRTVSTERRDGVEITLTPNAAGTPAGGVWDAAITQAGTLLFAPGQTFYDDNGRLDYTLSATGSRTTYAYDAAGRQTATTVDIDGDLNTTGDQQTSTAAYDSTGRLQSSTDALNHDTFFDYDALGRVIRTTLHDGSFTSTQYDAFGRRSSQTDQLGRTTNYEYDTQGRLTAVVLPAIDPANGNTTRPRYEYAYDDFGNQTLITDPIGVSTTGDPNDRQTQFTYDHRGRQLTRVLPDGSTESMHYDDTPIATVQAGSAPELSSGGGQLEYQIDFEGHVTAYRYDNTPGGGGRLVGKYYYDNLTDYNNDPTLASAARSVAYSFDAFGRLIETDDSAHGVTKNVFDIEGRLIQIESPEGILNYAYNDLGQKTRVWTSKTTSGADAVTDTRYTYDALGRLETVDVVERADAAVTENPTTYFYDAVGNLDAILHANGITVDYQYDALNRLVELYHFTDTDADRVYDVGEMIAASFQYTLDAAGNRVASAEVVDGDSFDYTWRYDGLNRLVEERLDAGDNALHYTDTFTYDLTGNRTAHTHDLGSDGSVEETTTYTHDANDKLVTETFDSTLGNGTEHDRHTVYTNLATVQDYKIVYDGLDATGQIQERTDLVYGVNGRLASTTVTTFVNGVTSQVVLTDYAYNDSGLRVTETTTTDGGTPVVKRFLFDPSNPTGYAQVLEEYIDGALSKTFTLGHDVISQHDTSGGGVLTLLTDGHGSTRALLNTLGVIIEQYAYEAYGNMLEGTNLTTAQAALTSLLYSGEWTQANGQQYLRARFYDPTTGTFNRLDPFAGLRSNPQSFNKYSYAHANPIMEVDPTGEFGVTVNSTHITIALAAILVAGTIGGIAHLSNVGPTQRRLTNAQSPQTGVSDFISVSNGAQNLTPSLTQAIIGGGWNLRRIDTSFKVNATQLILDSIIQADSRDIWAYAGHGTSPPFTGGQITNAVNASHANNGFPGLMFFTCCFNSSILASARNASASNVVAPIVLGAASQTYVLEMQDLLQLINSTITNGTPNETLGKVLTAWINGLTGLQGTAIASPGNITLNGHDVITGGGGLNLNARIPQNLRNYNIDSLKP